MMTSKVYRLRVFVHLSICNMTTLISPSCRSRLPVLRCVRESKVHRGEFGASPLDLPVQSHSRTSKTDSAREENERQTSYPL